jgi:hypothetical protein
VVEGISWQWIFWLNLPIALSLAAFALTRMRESFGPPAALDIPGLALVTGAAFGIVWGLVRGNAAGWSSAEVLGAFTGGGTLTLAFVGWELRAAEPMVPMRVFRSARFSSGNAAMFLLWGSALGSVFFMAQFLQTALGHGPLAAGLGLMPWGATTVFVPPIAGALINRVGERPLIAAGLSLNAAAMAWIALIAAPDLAYWQLVAPLVISGTGIAMASPAATSSVMTSVAPQLIGKASGSAPCASSAARSASPSWSRCSPPPAATHPPRSSATDSRPRSAPARASRCSAHSRASRYPPDVAPTRVRRHRSWQHPPSSTRERGRCAAQAPDPRPRRAWPRWCGYHPPGLSRRLLSTASTRFTSRGAGLREPH